MPTALITGITGQDGSHLAELLLGKGYKVCGMVRRSSTENFQRIEHLRDRITLYQGDLLDQVLACVDWRATLAERSLVELHAVQAKTPSSWVETNHEVPRIVSLISASAKISSQKEGRNICELRKHKFRHGPRIQFGSVEIKNGEVTADQGNDVLVTDTMSTETLFFQRLGKHAREIQVRLFCDRIR